MARLLEDLDSKWKKQKPLPHFSLLVSSFCVFGIMCLELLTDISYPKFLENDIACPRQNVQQMKG